MDSIATLLTDLGIDYEVRDDEAYAACPFHSPDRHPSWSINLESGLHFCFSCGAKGSLSHLVSYVCGITYAEATLTVNQAVGFARAYKWLEDQQNVNFSPMYMKVPEAEMALFTDPPLEALASRNMTLDSARKYEVRWNPNHQSWVFPFRDPYNNDLWGWQEKNERIFRNFPQGTRKSCTLFGLSVVPDGSPVILVESPADAVVLDSAGITGGVSSFGVSVSDIQLALIQQRTEELTLALDSDTPGMDGTRAFITKLAGKVSMLRIFNYGVTGAKDPGEMTYDQIRDGYNTAIPAIIWARDYDEAHKED